MPGDVLLMLPTRKDLGLLGLLALAIFAGPARAFEDTEMLPAGVRNIDIRAISTSFDEKTDAMGTRQPLAQPLDQALTFDTIAKGESTLKGNQLRAFLNQNGLKLTDSVGSYSADLHGHLNVFAPVFGYGITDNLNVGLAVPIYDATTSVSVGFQPNATAQQFLNLLSDPKTNSTANARDAATQINSAVSKLNQKLKDNHYSELSSWHAQGVGDSTLAAKYRAVNSDHVVVAILPGVVLPTGKTKDPNVLTDIPFGNGVVAPYAQMNVDEKVGFGFIFNEYVKYTNQLPSTETVRAVTPDEKIAVDYTSTNFKLGDMFDTGASLRWWPSFGLMAAVGGTYHHKYGDRYAGGIDPETKVVLQQDSDAKATTAEAMLGYSTVPLYFRHEVPVPLDVRLTYSRQVWSTNTPVTDMAMFDLNLYF
jgi:hypothetical protein